MLDIIKTEINNNSLGNFVIVVIQRPIWKPTYGNSILFSPHKFVVTFHQTIT